ncbi:hypothetical protein [Halobaculum limi]|uniref:hypothetical protein n=1 Tax=Halobaculum limi TaxID=3031916 RepID=UPI002404DE52|nr:hypothetical protein [Halobaculum sp. YSMS11]
MSSTRHHAVDRASERDREADPGWWTSFGYYGVWQVFGFGLPFIWLAFQSPTRATLLGPAVIVGLYAAALAIAAGRQGYHVGASWPRLSRRKLGTGVGYRRFLRRFCVVAAAVSLATFGGVLAGRVGGEFVAAGVAFAVAVGVLAFVPVLARDSTRARVARAGVYLAGLAVAAIVARPFDPATAITSAPLAFGAVAVASCYDLSVPIR